MSKPSNMRRWRTQSERRLVWLVFLSLLLIGGGVTGLVYGWQALLTALPCLAAGGAGLLLAYLLLVGIEKWRARA